MATPEEPERPDIPEEVEENQAAQEEKPQEQAQSTSRTPDDDESSDDDRGDGCWNQPRRICLCRGRSVRRRKQNKPKKKKYYQPDIPWSGLPTTYEPCVHLHFKTKTISREELTQQEYSDMLATPKGYSWLGKPTKKMLRSRRRRYRRKARRVRRQKQNRGEVFAHEFMTDMWQMMTPELQEKIVELLTCEFGMEERKADKIVRCTKVCKCIKKKKKKPRISVRNVWIREFSTIIADKITDYIVTMLMRKRTPRVKKIAETILKHLCDITGEKTTLHTPQTRIQRLMVLSADRLALWLDDMFKESKKAKKPVESAEETATPADEDSPSPEETTTRPSPKPESEKTSPQQSPTETTPPGTPEGQAEDRPGTTEGQAGDTPGTPEGQAGDTPRTQEGQAEDRPVTQAEKPPATPTEPADDTPVQSQSVTQERDEEKATTEQQDVADEQPDQEEPATDVEKEQEEKKVEAEEQIRQPEEDDEEAAAETVPDSDAAQNRPGEETEEPGDSGETERPIVGDEQTTDLTRKEEGDNLEDGAKVISEPSLEIQEGDEGAVILVSDEKLPSPVTITDKKDIQCAPGMTFAIRRGDGSHYEVSKLSSFTVAEKVALARNREVPIRGWRAPTSLSPVTSASLQEWTLWAKDVAGMAEEWNNWIERTIREVEKKGEAVRPKSGEGKRKFTKTEKLDWEKWKLKKEMETMGYRVEKKKIQNAAKMWDKKVQGKIAHPSKEEITKITDLTIPSHTTPQSLSLNQSLSKHSTL